MNWKLIFALSLFGLAMGLATISLIPSHIEPFFWLVIFIICAAIIARRAPGRYFLHGFMVSIVNSIWITAAHVLGFMSYVACHPQINNMGASMPLHNHPRQLMLITGPIIGAVSGLVLGLFAYIAAKIRKK